MPYLVNKVKEHLVLPVELKKSIITEGMLNYIMTQAVIAFMENNDGLCYRNINAVIGALECCKLEAYRRLEHYENKKILENGDVYPEELTK